MFFKRRKKLKIRCYPQFDHAAKIFPIEKTRSFIPDWWKNLSATFYDPKSSLNISTIKACPGFVDLYKKGITIPLWRDSVIKYDSERIVDVVIPTDEPVENLFVLHSVEQWQGLLPGHLHFKIVSPWMLETDEPVQFLMMDMTWNRKDSQEYLIPPGIVEFKYQHATHINVFLPPTKGFRELKLEAGTPMVQLIPLTDREIELEIMPADSNKFKNLLPYAWTFNNVYAKTKNILEKRK